MRLFAHAEEYHTALARWGQEQPYADAFLEQTVFFTAALRAASNQAQES